MSWFSDLFGGGGDTVTNTSNSNSSTDVSVNPEVYVINDFGGVEPLLAQLANVEIVSAAMQAEGQALQAKAITDAAKLLAVVATFGVVLFVRKKAK